ncbi:LTA synthase family protein [Stecheria intestinalis]|uniref:LTA synthase family protein n=1 Tax=Stecheria intestinalis TaxID=2606630 RepID=UPI0023F3DF2D|nr:LTA synthase family protein [Stecheria intestinalis]MDD5880782.1 LTA synthase family protein [Stecheria intestinalis]
MKQRTARTWINVLFVILIAASLVLAFMPRSSRLQLFVPEKSQTDAKEQVLSAAGMYSGTAAEGVSDTTDSGQECITIELPKEESDQDSIAVVSQSPDLNAYYYWGIQFMKYYSASSLNAYSETTFTHPKNTYFEDDMTFAEAVEKYQAEGYMLLFSVKGDSRRGWSDEMEEAMRSAGIETTPRKGAYFSAYIAYVYQGETFSEADDTTVTKYITINGHRIYMTSAGVYHGNRSSIRIDGDECSASGNGINLTVYDPETGSLIDAISWNTNTSDPVMTRDDSLFYTEYTITISGQLLDMFAVRQQIVTMLFRDLYLLLAFVLVLMFLDARNIEKHIALGTPVKTWTIVLKQIPIVLLGVLAVAADIGYTYLRTSFKDVSMEQLVFHMNTNLTGTNWSTFSDLFEGMGLGAGIIAASGILLAILYVHLGKHPEQKKWKFRMRSVFWLRWTTVLAAIVAISVAVDSFWWNYGVYDYLVNSNFDAEVFDDYYADPSEVQITFPEEKKNLIYIYMESMEISAADEASGGGKAFNAIPELTELAFENDNFEGEETGVLNGGIPLTNCTWTIAGITAQSAGVYLGVDNAMANRRGSMEQFLPGATTIGDILEENGYTNVFMLGSDAKFGNRNEFFGEHGDFEIDDYYWAKREGLIPPDYFVWWGYEDKKLFEYAKDKATELAEGDQPFNLTLLTVDTHFTGGYLCEDCPDTYSQQYSNVIACSSKRVADFVAWVQEQDWGKDTVIVLSGDHLCMDSQYYSDMPSGYERKTYVCIINSQKEETDKRRTFATIDLFPTTLAALGAEIEGDRLGLGTDLYSDTPTLVELRGEDWMNSQFAMNSDFYKQKILYGNDVTDSE